jgi:SAM-dependent methyltransferase
MIADLIRRSEVSGAGRLLDLACGTGQLAFPLRRWFSQVWAVDREPEMAGMVQAKAELLGADNLRPIVADAETLDAPPGYFELAVIGNAFHRLDRDLVADRLLNWLRPGGCVALCWSTAPSPGDQAWQQALTATLDKWRGVLGVEDRIPPNWDEPRRLRPDHQVLTDAGFAVAGHHEFVVKHRWCLPELAGYVRSASFLAAPVLGERGAAFDADLAATLAPFAEDGGLAQIVNFAYDLARRDGG